MIYIYIMNIPFKMSGSNKNIYSNNQLDLNFQLKNYNLLEIIEKMTEKNDLKLMKASESKKYYEKINKTKKE